MHLVILVAVTTLLNVDSTVEAKPTLRVVSKNPVAVRGHAFQPRESVRLIALGSLKRVTVRTTADERGEFKAGFTTPTEGCTLLVVAAVGSEGSRASVKVPRRPCTPPRLPPPRL